jgi:hypothetical protein
MANKISNYDDIIDSRDVIARIEELAADVARLVELRDADTLTDEERDELAEITEAVTGADSELAVLQALADEASSAADWQYGEALIRDSYFVEYAQQLADDLGVIDSDAKWPANHIDWEAAADELKVDYFNVEFDGVTYWIR